MGSVSQFGQTQSTSRSVTILILSQLLMESGADGPTGAVAHLPVEAVNSRDKDSATTRPHNTGERRVRERKRGTSSATQGLAVSLLDNNKNCGIMAYFPYLENTTVSIS